MVVFWCKWVWVHRILFSKSDEIITYFVVGHATSLVALSARRAYFRKGLHANVDIRGVAQVSDRHWQLNRRMGREREDDSDQHLQPGLNAGAVAQSGDVIPANAARKRAAVGDR